MDDVLLYYELIASLRKFKGDVYEKNDIDVTGCFFQYQCSHLQFCRR